MVGVPAADGAEAPPPAPAAEAPPPAPPYRRFRPEVAGPRKTVSEPALTPRMPCLDKAAVRAGPGQMVPVLQTPLGGAVAPTNCQVETALPEVSPQVELVLPEVSVAENALPEEGNTTAPPGPASEVPAGGSLWLLGSSGGRA